MSTTRYEAVIGLEVHVQVKTASKMFSRSATGYGAPVNSLTDPVVLALPGVLPVLNRAAIELTVKAGLLLGCRIAPRCKWDRKNYFYPDSPKNYQISQYDQPLCLGGSVEIELPGSARNVMGEHKSIPLTRIHLEEDVGKLNHGSFDSLIDYNRAGTPLMEIVSEPALQTADEAFAYLTALKTIMVYGGISDCDMEKGQLRCDANVSIRPVGDPNLGTKVELKNLNSISFVRDGIAHEIKRQIGVVTAGGTIVQETRDYDGQTGQSQSLRSKEQAHDYRYFPDPDLMPVEVDAAWKARIQATCPELPFDKQRRFQSEYGIPYTLTSVLVPDRALSDFFEEAAKAGAKAQAVGNWIANDLLRELGAAKRDLAHSKIRPAHIAGLVKLIDADTLTQQTAREVFAEMFASGETPDAVVARKGLRADQPPAELEQWCRDAIAADARSLADFKSGKDSAINAFKGPVMKAAKGRANPKLVDETLRRILATL
ncbi:MAG TPA: Asp-tRNA(Asn)/Glu-tRNA(Gln) amidotransferase subunit GatB [Opitutaceae bacterium]|jgi:aspartyl-tRNA(Asn)/glutamyl-tRNA(Gln) amidotransferase subunit B